MLRGRPIIASHGDEPPRCAPTHVAPCSAQPHRSPGPGTDLHHRVIRSSATLSSNSIRSTPPQRRFLVAKEPEGEGCYRLSKQMCEASSGVAGKCLYCSVRTFFTPIKPPASPAEAPCGRPCGPSSAPQRQIAAWLSCRKTTATTATDSGCVDLRATKTLARLRLGLEKFTEVLWREIGLAKDRSQRAAG